MVGHIGWCVCMSLCNYSLGIALKEASRSPAIVVMMNDDDYNFNSNLEKRSTQKWADCNWKAAARSVIGKYVVPDHCVGSQLIILTVANESALNSQCFGPIFREKRYGSFTNESKSDFGFGFIFSDRYSLCYCYRCLILYFNIYFT